MIVAIHQPNFLPWLGYFYKILTSDTFVLLDNVQYIKNGFVNRNRIKTSQGAIWLTVPVNYRYPQLIQEVGIDNKIDWRKKHLKTLELNYKKSTYFQEIFEAVTAVYRAENWENLSQFNFHLLKLIASYLGISTEILVASKLQVEGHSTNLLVQIVKKVGGNVYLSGFGGAKYQDEAMFLSEGIQLNYYDFKHPVYPQLWGEFLPRLSIIDLLFNCGRRSREILLEG